MTDTTSPLPPVVDRDTWTAQVNELRVRETAHTREGDAIAAGRSPRMKAEHRSWWMNKWFLPAFSVALGVVAWLSFWAGGNPSEGVFSFVLMTLIGAALLIGGGSETMRAIRGDGRDERWQMIDLRATALSGLILITVILVKFFLEIANGRDGSPYGELAAVAGTTYLVGFFIGKWKS